uniref:Uncharacterized protein n=1 Tax=Vitrella brassicaformis TaxID=1169539 RepID=A0A7S1PCU0_9ALVE
MDAGRQPTSRLESTPLTHIQTQRQAGRQALKGSQSVKGVSLSCRQAGRMDAMNAPYVRTHKRTELNRTEKGINHIERMNRPTGEAREGRSSTYACVDGQTYTETYRQTDRQTDIHTDRRMTTHTER